METPTRKTIGPYMLHRRLRAGATGSLWLAENRHNTIGHKVVVKIVNDRVVDLDAVARQAESWAQVSYKSNLIPLIEVGNYDGQLIVVTDYLPGGSLEDRLSQHLGQPLPYKTAINIMGDILAGLEAAHSRRIIYRDLNPSKVLFSGGTARLLWPSLAHLGEDEGEDRLVTTVAQTLPYSSPEVLMLEGISEQSDLWSAGVIFYCMLSGKLPFPFSGLAGFIKAIVESDPPITFTLPVHLSDFFPKALAKEPRARFGSAAEMRAAVLGSKTASPDATDPNAGVPREPPDTLPRPDTGDFTNTAPDPRREAQPRSPLQPGKVLQGRYEVLGLIGCGGMGCVYRARHLMLGNILALKENLTEVSESYVRLFMQEGRLLANLHHPQLPRVLDFFIEDGRSYFVMDFVEGQSLHELLSQGGGPVAEEKVVDIAVTVCRVLEYLHTQSPPIVHCDIKPHNLLITPGGVVKLLDLGIARLITETAADDEHISFTPSFAAPEQWMGKVTPRSDIFCLGATMYNLLTGSYIRDTMLPNDFLSAQPLRTLAPKVSGRLEEVVNKCLREREQDRWQTAGELREALETLWSGGGSRPPREEYDVFISYRRQNGATEARLIRAELREHDIRVFLDVDDLGAGHFDQALLNRIAASPSFIVVLSPNCLERCRDERDWLRQEIVQAIKTNRKIIPVMLPGFQFPDPQTLPEEMRALITHQSLTYSHEYFEAMIKKLTRYLKEQ